MTNPGSSRRDFLTGRIIRDSVESAGSQRENPITERIVPERGPSVLLQTTAMACDFDVILNPSPVSDQVQSASQALDLVHELEQQLSVYRSDSELSNLNRRAFDEAACIDSDLFRLLLRGKQISEQTEGAFDPAAGVLVNLWRSCRQESRIPNQSEIEQALKICGVAQVQFNDQENSIRFLRHGIEFNLGAIGKGYAVDRACESLVANGVTDWLVHGGRSSIRASGYHAGHDGWPIGLRNPLLPDKPFATFLLKDEAIGTSGTAVQWFRHQGKRYGHILDPRSGWPVESLLSVSVIAPDAALADALSTAFFVLGVEKSLKCCDNIDSRVGAIFFPLPRQGQALEPILHNIPSERWFAI